MGDNHRRKAKPAHQPAHEIEQAGLDRNIKATRWLIHEDEARRGHKIAGNLQALPHAAGIGPGAVIDTVSRYLNAG